MSDRVQLRTSPASAATPTVVPTSPAGLPTSTVDAPLTTVPTVTSLSPSVPASSSPRVEPPAREHHRREHASSVRSRAEEPRASTHRRDRTSAREPAPVAPRAAVEASKPAGKAARATPTSTRERDNGSLEAKAPSKPAATAPKAAAAPAKSQNSDELDLDELVQKALKGGKSNVAASDNPILGL